MMSFHTYSVEKQKKYNRTYNLRKVKKIFVCNPRTYKYISQHYQNICMYVVQIFFNVRKGLWDGTFQLL